MSDDVEAEGRRLLGVLTGRADADFHAGQWEAIEALVVERRRVLVVQRTGWGKSAVYFIATKLLRDQGAGPTLLLSPLLALMRNQIEAARRMGVRAETINSSNPTEWAEIVARIQDDDVDLLLVSPERLANARFRDEVLSTVGGQAGLIVVDEAHCISDWGHDFRPNYRRIRRIMESLEPGIPVMACTATANDRVVADISAQLGEDLLVVRGPLARRGLALSVIDLPAPAQRLAWLAEIVPTLPGSGIVYCLTKADAQQVTDFLLLHGIDAGCYTGASEGREQLEQQLLANEVKVVVATSALGMGFDKPDLAFVIHFQSPGSPISYYQQVGRAGRQLMQSSGVLLRGTEDTAIQDWFIARAFPSREEATEVVDVLERNDGYTSLRDVQAQVNVRPSRIELLMTNLEVDGAIASDGKTYRRTGDPWTYDDERVAAITALRRDEQDQMRAYGTPDAGCRMAYLQGVLDDPDTGPCGICDRCMVAAGEGATADLPAEVDPVLLRSARGFLRSQPRVIVSRKQQPDGKRIGTDRRVEDGRALCRWGDGGWGELVRIGREVDQHFDDELVTALAALVTTTWQPTPAPTWITWVPSRRRPKPVADLAARLGAVLDLPVHDAVEQVADTASQRTMENSARQLDNVRYAYAVPGPMPEGPVLLVDDLVDSRWTLTVVGARLRGAGCPAILPLALADAGPA